MTRLEKEQEKLEARENIFNKIDVILAKKEEPELQIFIKSVSRSGMSRKMIVLLNNINISYDINILMEQKQPSDGNMIYNRINGCGMDMTFWLADYLTKQLWPSKEDRPAWLSGNGGGCLKWHAIY